MTSYVLYMTRLGTNSTGLVLIRILSATLRPVRPQGLPKAAPCLAESMVFTIFTLFNAERELAVVPLVTPTL